MSVIISTPAPYSTRVTELRTMRWTVHVACILNMKKNLEYLLGEWGGREHMEKLMR